METLIRCNILIGLYRLLHLPGILIWRGVRDWIGLTVKPLYTNPLFKNLSPCPRRESQYSGCLRTLRYPSFRGQVLNLFWFVMVWLVLKSPELRTPGGLRFLIWRLVVNVFDEVHPTNMAEPA